MISGTTTSPALAVRGLIKTYAGVRAVNDLTFSVSAGVITGLIGPNGCGKSTSIDCVSGFQLPDAGEVWLNGENISGLSAHRIAKLGLTRTFQNVRLYDDLTVSDNLLIAAQEYDGHGWLDALMARRALRASEASAAQRARHLIAEVGLARCGEWPAGMLSYGQKKLVALAACLMARPRVVILDEPLAGVNPTMVTRIERIITALNQAGQTFLIVEHNMNFVMRCCHQVIVMESGRTLIEGPPTLIRHDERVIHAYLGHASQRDAEHA